MPDDIFPEAEVFMATLYLTEQYSVVKIEGEALRVQLPNDRSSQAPGRVVRSRWPRSSR
jgi:hypothetical protein